MWPAGQRLCTAVLENVILCCIRAGCHTLSLCVRCSVNIFARHKVTHQRDHENGSVEFAVQGGLRSDREIYFPALGLGLGFMRGVGLGLFP